MIKETITIFVPELYSFFLNISCNYLFLGFEQVSYIDPDRKIASSLGSNGTELKDIGVEMTAGGAENELAFLNDDKDGDNLLSVASNVLGRSSSNEGYKILLEQAIYEMTRGSYSVALQYLNKAVQVKSPFDKNILLF